MLKKHAIIALTILLSAPAYASNELTITSAMKVVLGQGGKIVGPFTVYGPSGERLLDIAPGGVIEMPPAQIFVPQIFVPGANILPYIPSGVPSPCSGIYFNSGTTSCNGTTIQ